MSESKTSDNAPNFNGAKRADAIISLAMMSGRQRRALIGADCRGVCDPELGYIEMTSNNSAQIPFVDNISIHGTDGRFHSVTLSSSDLIDGDTTVDYSDPIATSANSRRYPTALQPTSAGLARMCPHAFEEQVRQSIYDGLTASEFNDHAISRGYEGRYLAKLKATTANIYQRGVISESLHNATHAGNAGQISVVRSFAPTLRQGLFWTCAPEHRRANQALAAMPALALLNGQLRRHGDEGLSRKGWAARTGLQPTIREILPQTVSNISYNRFGRHRTMDASLLDDLDWVNRQDVLDAFKGRGVMRQRPTADISCRIAAIVGHDLAAAFAIGFIASLEDIRNEGVVRDRQDIIDYVCADDDFLTRAVIRKYNPKISFDELRNRSQALVAYCAELEAAAANAGGKPGGSNQKQDWMPDPPPRRRRGWWLRPVTARHELMVFGRHLQNCAATYGDRIDRGVSAIFVSARLPIKTDQPGRIIQDPATGEALILGSMVEIVRGSDGKPLLAQHFAARNTAPPPSLRAFVRNWIFNAATR